MQRPKTLGKILQSATAMICIINKMLKKATEARYQNAEEIIQGLQDA
jgi:hypothetical protein